MEKKQQTWAEISHLEVVKIEVAGWFGNGCQVLLKHTCEDGTEYYAGHTLWDSAHTLDEMITEAQTNFCTECNGCRPEDLLRWVAADTKEA